MKEKATSMNLKRLRKTKDFTQEHLAKKSGLSLSVYQSIERGRYEPSVSNLRAIATSLDVPIQRLIEPVKHLAGVRFRSNRKMRNRDQVLADVARWLGDFVEIEDILDDHVSYRLEDIPSRVRARNHKEDRGKIAADLVREELRLDEGDPVRNICGLLESCGIKVGEQKVASNDFFGLSVSAEGMGPAVVVNTWEGISVERWIFTAVHELGHLVLHTSDYDVKETNEEQEHEEEANSFASSFLMPDASFQKEWRRTSGLAFIERVMKVKRIFNVSYRAVLYRCARNWNGSGNIWARFNADYKRRYGRSLLREDEPAALARDIFRASFPDSGADDEPDKLSPIDFTQDRLSRLVRMAIEREEISLSRGAEIMDISLQDMRDLSKSWVE